LPIIFLFSTVSAVKTPPLLTTTPDFPPIQMLSLESTKTTLFFLSSSKPSFFVYLINFWPLYFEMPPHEEVIQIFPDLSSLKSVTMPPEKPSFSENFTKLTPSNLHTPPP
jgi:hypothetical protein